MDPVQERVLELIKAVAPNQHGDSHLAAHLTFFIKHVAGPRVKAEGVSITRTFLWDDDGVGWAEEKIIVAVHRSPRNTEVVVSKTCGNGENIVNVLDEKVYRVIEEDIFAKCQDPRPDL